VKLDEAALDHRRFWDAMDLLSQADLAAIETQVYGGMIDRYGLDLASVALDMTNFATYIDSTNGRAPIAQRGKAKQKRVDLRLVGLALVVTRDGGIPIVSHAYPGDRPDVTQFSTVLDELVARNRLLVNGVESLTVVYDAGQNSHDNHTLVEQAGIGFVGSLPPSDHPDLLDISRSRYRVVDADRFGDLTAFDTTVTALGVTRRAVLTHSPTLHAGQSRGLDQTLTKARARLTDLQARLHRGNTRRPRAKVEACRSAPCTTGPTRRSACTSLLRARPGHSTPDAPPSRPSRTAPVRPRTTRPPRRHRRDRPATPRRRQRPPPRPAHPHRHERHPTPPVRPVRSAPLHTDPLTSTTPRVR
jgi:hypothetical protein